MTLSLNELSTGEVTTSAPVLLFSIPREDAKFFATAIPESEQQRVRERLKIVNAIHAARKKVPECKRLSALLNPNFALEKKFKRGTSPVSLKRDYYNYVRTGDWRVLMDMAKAPMERVGLPHAFLEFWRKLCGNNQRKCKPAHEELLCIWRTRFDWNNKEYKAIPGYAQWPEPERFTEIPAGWSYENLMRHAPDEYEKKAIRIGRAAASANRLKVYSSRVGLRVGQFYEFDDHEFNLKINFPGQRKAMRPRGFTCIDVLSGCAFAQSFKPTLWDEVEEKKKVLTEQDMMWFVVHVLTRYGYRDDERGTALVVEWGTAAIRKEFEQRILDATNGKVRVERSGKFGAPTHKGQFEGTTKGNFRFKALVESLFNLLDNHLASLPGQVGKDRNHSPEELHGAEQYNNKLLRAATALPAHRAELIQYPFLKWTEFLERAGDAYNRINSSTQHKLQGWEKLGFVETEWRMSELSDFVPYSALLALPAEQQKVVSALIQQNDALIKTRRLSRMEVFQSQKNELSVVPHFLYPTLVGRENCVKNPKGGNTYPVRDGIFEITDRDIDSDPLRFVAVNEYGQRLPEGERYICFVNPFDPSVLVACDEKLKVVAECQRTLEPTRGDIEKIHAAQGAAKKWEANANALLDLRHIDDAQSKTAMHERNAEILSGKPLSQLKEENRAAAVLQSEINARARNGESDARKQNLASEAEQARAALALQDEE